MDHAEETPVGPPRGAGAAHRAAAAAAPDPAPPGPTAGSQAPAPRGYGGLVARVKALLAWWAGTRVGRANTRFGAAGGGLLTGGIAYSALFSVFAGLTLGYATFMAVLGGHEGLRTAVLDALASTLPGLIDTGDGQGLLNPNDLRLGVGLSVAGAVALVMLVLSAVSAVGALRTALRAMFQDRSPSNPFTGRLRELAGFAGFAGAVLVSAIAGVALTSAADWALGLLGWRDVSGLVVRVLGIAVTFVIDAGVFMLLIRMLAGQHPPRRDLLGGAALAALGLGVVRVLGTSVVAGSVRANPVLASFAVVVVLLAWINLVARIVLLAAAWTSDPSGGQSGPPEPISG